MLALYEARSVPNFGVAECLVDVSIDIADGVVAVICADNKCAKRFRIYFIFLLKIGEVIGIVKGIGVSIGVSS